MRGLTPKMARMMPPVMMESAKAMREMEHSNPIARSFSELGFLNFLMGLSFAVTEGGRSAVDCFIDILLSVYTQHVLPQKLFGDPLVFQHLDDAPFEEDGNAVADL